MLSIEELLDEYALARDHSLALIADLGADEVAWRPEESGSSIAWHLGHQAAVNHYMVRNLTAAEVSFDQRFDAVFDSANPEPARGDLPPLDAIVDYRDKIAESTVATVRRIADGNVGAPRQLALIADGMLRAIINHEYQHSTWIEEVRSTMTETPAPAPESSRLVVVEGYHLLANPTIRH